MLMLVRFSSFRCIISSVLPKIKISANGFSKTGQKIYSFTQSFAFPSLLFWNWSSETVKLNGAASSNNRKELKSIIQTADKMYEANLFVLLKDFLAEKLDDYPGDLDLTWRFVRALYEKSKLCKRDAEKGIILDEAEKSAFDCLKKHPGDFQLQKWFAIVFFENLRHNTSMLDYNKRSIEAKNQIMKAIEIESSDPVCYLYLGLWYYDQTKLPFYRKIIGRFVEKNDFSSINYGDLALDCFQKCATLSETPIIRNSLMLGKLYNENDRKEMAKKYLNEAVDAVVLSFDDKLAHDEACDLLNKITL